MRKLSSIVALLVSLAMNLALAAAASAAYPGENGKIFFQSCGLGGCSHYDVYSVNPDGSELKNLTEALTAPEGLPDTAYEPSVSADGKRVAFSVDSQAEAEIWVMNADGAEPHQLTHDNLLDWAPAISPDGNRIAWTQWSPFPTYGDRDIWVMNSDGGGQELLFNGSNADGFPQYTPDGQTIVMGSEEGDVDIRKVPSTPAVPPLTTATAVAADKELLETEPNVSPDGSRVAFIQVPKSSPLDPFDIYSVSIEGGATTPGLRHGRQRAVSDLFAGRHEDGLRQRRCADDRQRRRQRHSPSSRNRRPRGRRRLRLGAEADGSCRWTPRTERESAERADRQASEEAVAPAPGTLHLLLRPTRLELSMQA
jgi:Tol biopolymer transport system component